MKQIVYAVESGYYSDYGIEGLFSTKEKAQHYIDVRKREDEYWDEERIVEYELDELATARWVSYWHCGIFIDTGEIKEHHGGESRELTSSRKRGEILQDAVSILAYSGRLFTRVKSYVSAEHAQKLAVEARQAHLRKESTNGAS